MQKMQIKTYDRITFVGITLIILFFVVFTASFRGPTEPSITFGGGKFELFLDGDLFYNGQHDTVSRSLVTQVEGYNFQGKFLYIVGDYVDGYTIVENKAVPVSYYDIASDALNFYDWRHNAPVLRYLIINVANDEVNAYADLKDVPVEKQHFFHELVRLAPAKKN